MPCCRDCQPRSHAREGSGFADPPSRAVFVVSNAEWRPFGRHEIMHVVAYHAWGRPAPGTDWLQEGLAQAADGMCGGYSNAEAMAGLIARHGWIPFDAMLLRFRAQPDLRAYLQAAVFVEYLLRRFGRASLETIWRDGARADSRVGGRRLRDVDREWRAEMRGVKTPPVQVVDRIESTGCG